MAIKKTKKEDISINYTTDNENSQLIEVPSISQLLNRKKLNISRSLRGGATLPQLTRIPKDRDESAAKNAEKSLTHSQFPPRQVTTPGIVAETNRTNSPRQTPSNITLPEKKSPKQSQKTDEPSQKKSVPHAPQSAQREISISFESGSISGLEMQKPTQTPTAVSPPPVAKSQSSIELSEPPPAPAPPINDSPINISDGHSDSAIVIEAIEPPTPAASSQEPRTVAPEGSAPVSIPKITPGRRKNDQSVVDKRPLIRWNQETLSRTRDPLGQGLLKFLQGGATSILFLAIQAPPTGKKLPVFVSTACFGDGAKASLWAGVTWDPEISPDIWNQFVKKGSAVYTPDTVPPLMRFAFGLESNHYLTLLRVGPSTSCRGLLMITSETSLLSLVKGADEILMSVSIKKKKAA